MDAYGTAQLDGDRDTQCDATAVWTAPGGTRAYALLDGVGDTLAVRAWPRSAARCLARTAALQADAEAGLRAEYDRYAAEPARTAHHDLPAAAAVIAVLVPGELLSVAWSGDARAYILLDGRLRLLTEDHNERRAYEGGDRNLITACLGGGQDDRRTEELWGHPAVEVVRGPTRPGWLLLASDGAYEPHEDADHEHGWLSGRRTAQGCPAPRRGRRPAGTRAAGPVRGQRHRPRSAPRLIRRRLLQDRLGGRHRSTEILAKGRRLAL